MTSAIYNLGLGFLAPGLQRDCVMIWWAGSPINRRVSLDKFFGVKFAKQAGLLFKGEPLKTWRMMDVYSDLSVVLVGTVQWQTFDLQNPMEKWSQGIAARFLNNSAEMFFTWGVFAPSWVQSTSPSSPPGDRWGSAYHSGPWKHSVVVFPSCVGVESRVCASPAACLHC